MRRGALRTLGWIFFNGALLLAFVYLQAAAVQVVHDSCRFWREPPLWVRLCTPSTRHGQPPAVPRPTGVHT